MKSIDALILYCFHVPCVYCIYPKHGRITMNMTVSLLNNQNKDSLNANYTKVHND